MPKYVESSGIWCPIDPFILARNWAAASKRMGNKASLLRGLAQAANQLAGQGRIMFQAWRQEAAAFDESSGADPLWQWKYLDTAKNGRERYYDCQVMPRTAGTGDSKAYREGDTGSTSGILDDASVTVSTVNYPSSVRHERFDYSRGDRSDAEDTEGLTVTNGATLTGLIVRDKGALAHDIYNNDVDICSPSSPWRGDECVANVFENARAVVQALREDYLPVLGGWCANDCTSAAQPASTSPKGIKTTNTSYENALDTSFTTRSATSPGSLCFAYMYGRGAQDAHENNRKVKVRCYVLAEKSGTNDGTVKFEGPDTFTGSNSTEITVSAATPTWYGSGSTTVALDSSVGDTNATTSRNKIDVFVKVGASTTMWVYGWCFVMENV